MPTVRMQRTGSSLEDALGKLSADPHRRTGYKVSIYQGETALATATSRTDYADALALARQNAGIAQDADMTAFQLRVTVQARYAGASPRGDRSATYTDLF